MSPIEKVYYTDALLEGQMMSGMNALASYTMLNEENKQCLAMPKKDFKALNVAVDKQFGQNEIQVWKYILHTFAHRFRHNIVLQN